MYIDVFWGMLVFMSEAMVVLGVTETVQGDILKDRLYVRDVMEMGLSAFRTGGYQHTLRKETNSKISNACICLSLRS